MRRGEPDPGQARDLLLEAMVETGRSGPRDDRGRRSVELLDALVSLAAEYGFEAEKERDDSWSFRRSTGAPLLRMRVAEDGGIAGRLDGPDGIREVRPDRDLVYDPGRGTWLGPASKTHSVPGLPLVRFTALEHLVRTVLFLAK